MRMSKVCIIAGIDLAVAFIVKSIADYVLFPSVENSAPFSTTLLVNALVFLLPALILIFFGVMGRKRQ